MKHNNRIAVFPRGSRLIAVPETEKTERMIFFNGKKKKKNYQNPFFTGKIILKKKERVYLFKTISNTRYYAS